MRRPPLSLLVAYAIVGLFIVAEGRLRRGDEAKTLVASAADEGTTRLIGASFGAALAGTPLLAALPVGHLPLPGRVGPVLMALGLALRVWAATTLGRFYTRTLRTAPDQTVIRDGPYRLIRHPGYLGDLIMWVGFGLAARSWLATSAIAATMANAYRRRIRSEEAMLIASLGEPYRDYARETWRLVPGVY